MNNLASAKHNSDGLLAKFGQLVDAPADVADLRKLVVQLAVRGRLVGQDQREEPAVDLIKRTAAALPEKQSANPFLTNIEASITDESEYELPQGWAWLPLGHVGNWATGCGFPKQYQGEATGEYLFCKVSDMNLPGNEIEIRTTVNRIDSQVLKRIGARSNPAGTVIFPKIGGAIATHKRRLVGRPTIIDNNCSGIRPIGLTDSRWLLVLMRSLDLTKYQSGTSVPAVSQGALDPIRIGLPPLAEQKRIVAKVDELMALCDRLEAQLQERDTQQAALARAALARFADAPTPAKLELLFHDSFTITSADLRKTILTLAVQGHLVPQDPNDEPAFQATTENASSASSDSPPNWLSGTVFDLAELKSGSSFPGEMEAAQGEYLYVKVSDMNLPENQFEIRTSSRFVTPERRDLKGLIPAGSIIFPKRGGAIATNKKRLVRKPLFVDTNTMAMICPPFIELRYLHIWFLGIDLWELNSGTSVPQINNKDVGPLIIQVPPLAEQRRIVAKVDQLMALVDQWESQLAAARTTADHLLSALVTKLTRGS
jgi:type I restriction enzyme S subunit